MEDLLRSFWAVLGGVSEVTPELLRSCLCVEITRRNAFRGNFLEVCFRTPGTFSEVAPEVRPPVHTAPLRLNRVCPLVLPKLVLCSSRSKNLLEGAMRQMLAREHNLRHLDAAREPRHQQHRGPESQDRQHKLNQPPYVGCTPKGSCNRTLLRRVLRRFSNSKCFLEGFLEGACKEFQQRHGSQKGS